MKIAVLAGGISTERAVSIISGREVCRALREKGHDAMLIDVCFGIPDSSAAFGVEYDLDAAVAYMNACSKRLAVQTKPGRSFFGPRVLELCQSADVVFLALHGENGENGKVQAAFDLLNIRYTGTGHLSSAIAMDKGLTKKILLESNVPVPHGVVLNRKNYTDRLFDLHMEFPVVVKPCCGGSSVGVCIVHRQEDYVQALQEAFSYEEEIVVEDYVSGREFSVAVVDGEAYPVIEISPVTGFYDYRNKYTEGGAIETCPADLEKDKTLEMQEYARRGTEALMIEGYVRWDFLMDEAGRLYCLEANTLPGMTPTSLLPKEARALGMDFAELCETLIRISLKKYEEE